MRILSGNADNTNQVVCFKNRNKIQVFTAFGRKFPPEAANRDTRNHLKVYQYAPKKRARSRKVG